MTNIFGFTLQELESFCKVNSIEKYRAKQIIKWLYQDQLEDFTAMTNLPLNLRTKLTELCVIDKPILKEQLVSKDKKTIKFLFMYSDGNTVETVLMRQSYGNSVCVSSQVGCGMNCTFCASAVNGLTRNLTVGELLAQVLYINKLLQDNYAERINSIVIMGSGEPMANYDNVLNFIKLCHESYTLNLSYRSITLSTAGLIPYIEKLATEELPITLSISLHAPNDDIRTMLMPINTTYSIQPLILAAKNYVAKTNRRITFEYILIKDLNDQINHAKELAVLLRGILANVNIIPINPVSEKGYQRPANQHIKLFVDTLEQNHINVTVRREMGVDIQAACGQLRNKHLLK